MATATEAPATAEGPTSHTQNQGDALPNGLDPDQIIMLREAMEAWRVGDDGKGHSAMEHWDTRRTLIRIFGIGGFDIIQVHPPVQVAVLESRDSDNERSPVKYTVIYRALCRLVIRNRRGVQLAVFEDGAVDEGLKQPSLSAAHDQGYKGAMSGALKRCAMNLGDQFGLSLYNKASLVPVVHTPADFYRDLAVSEVAWNDLAELGRIRGMAGDDKVLNQKVWSYDRTVRIELGEMLRRRGVQLRPPPAVAAGQPTPTASPTPPTPTTPTTDAPPASTASAPTIDPVQDAVLAKLMGQIAPTASWNSLDVLTQVRGEADVKQLLGCQVQGPPPAHAWMPFQKLLDTRIAELKAKRDNRQSASAA